MELELIRTYFPLGVNGEIIITGVRQCFTIERPWLNNQHSISCIPEGRYELKKRYSARFGQHIQVVNVKGRSGILFHPANNALTELRGCIAPVSQLTGVGTGTQSRLAFEWLRHLVYEALKSGPVFLNIKPKTDDHQTKDPVPHAAVL